MNTQPTQGTSRSADVRNCTEELLSELYKNINMGMESLRDIIPKVKSSELSCELTKQLDSYSDFSDKTAKLLTRIGGQPKEKGMMSKMGAKIGIEMNTLVDATDAHIAQMIIEGTTMGITDTIRLVRDYENTNCSEDALSLAKEVVSYQEKVVDKMKSYL